MIRIKERQEIASLHVKAVRRSRDLTQEEFAEKIDVSSNTISRIERGETPLTADVALKINKHFFVSLDYLFGLTSHEEGSPPCSASCEDLLSAQTLIQSQDFLIKELKDKLDAIQRVLNNEVPPKLTIKRQTPQEGK